MTAPITHKATALPAGRSRSVAKSVPAIETAEGAGATVRRSIGTPSLRNLSPFLMLDHFKIPRGAGFPDHPHRGQATVTYLLSGQSEHEDFAGHRGVLDPGSLQWMTAGRGIVHSEMPLHVEGGPDPVGLQLWVDLPHKYKMMEPDYQELKAELIPTVELDNGAKVKVISGQSHGVEGPVHAFGGCYYYDIRLPPGSRVFQAIPKNWTAFAYTVAGDAVLFSTGDRAKKVGRFHTAVFTSSADEEGVEVVNAGEEEAHMILVAGEPLDQPVVQYGPFVMTSREEIMHAFRDYQTHSNGFERAANWQSEIGNRHA